MKKAIALVLVSTALLCVSGCQAYDVHVSALRSEVLPSPRSCYIISGDEDEGLKDTLQFKEYAGHVKRALESKGYVVTDNAREAESAVVIQYFRSDPEESISYKPIIGQTGVASSTTNGYVNTYSNSASFGATTYNTPMYGVTGQVPVATIFYVSGIRLTAVDIRDYAGNGTLEGCEDIWEIELFYSGEKYDLRELFPVMVGAGVDYIGENTGKEIKVHLFDCDKRVKIVRGID